MRVSHTWLCEWVDTRCSVDQLAERLTLGGLEVQLVEAAAPPLPKQVVIGQILSSEPHPQSDHLRVCMVDVGKQAGLTIICGASNAHAGVRAPVAMVGAKLPSLEVQEKEIRGVKSAGMLCSAEELGLDEQSDGIMIMQPDAPLGKPVSEYLDLSDSIIEIELTPNRGDCLSIVGIAREVSVLTGAKLKKQPSQKQTSSKQRNKKTRASLPIALEYPEACPRYVGRAVFNIDMSAPTPDWMKERLRRSDVRSINVVVDVTNYVMLELGQPMHAFDLEKLNGGIVVRRAKNKEELQLLDDSTVQLNHSHLVIADHQKAIALAGIMGGKNSAISDSTHDIYFESAFFQAQAMQGKAREFGMHTDASHRYERGVDPSIQVAAVERASQLLVSLAGGELGSIVDAKQQKLLPRSAKILFDQNEILRSLGFSLPASSVKTLFKKLGMQVAPNKKNLQVVPPNWRFDITGSHDLIEEVGRVVGFDQIEARMPSATATVGKHPENRIDAIQIKHKLVEKGYFEAITYSFVDPDIQQPMLGSRGIALSNPIADNMTVMRQSLWVGLLESVKKNLNRQHTRVRLFEHGKVFLESGGKNACEENYQLGGAVTGTVLPPQWGSLPREVDFFDVKGDVIALLELSAAGNNSDSHLDIKFHPAEHPALHPGRSARIELNKKEIGWLGQLHPKHQKLVEIEQPVYLFELDMSALANTMLPSFLEISRHPMIRRDLAVVVDSAVAAQDMLDAVRSATDDLLTELALFDIYSGENMEKNQKSFAFRLTFQSNSSNLIATEVDARIDIIINTLQTQFGAKLRV